jgi:raffinose/stachyose/melibiose transport system permease protein
MTTKGEKRFSYAVLVAPALLIYLSVVAFPTIFSILLSLTNYNGGKVFGNPKLQFVGFKSYVWMFTEPTGNFYTSLINNLQIVAVSVFGQIPIGFILAYILYRRLVKGSNLFQTMIFLPNVISPIIIGVLFKVFIVNPQSMYMEIIRLFNPNAVYNIGKAPMVPVLIVILWMFIGFYMVVFLANMQRIDPAIIEAARIDGAKERQVLGHVVLPAMSGVIVTCSILAISGSLRTFDLIFAMTAGGPAGMTRVLSLYMYLSAFQGSPNYPLANAISTVMVLISFILIIITQRVEKIFGGKD